NNGIRAGEGSPGGGRRRSRERGDADRGRRADPVQLACDHRSGAGGAVPATGRIHDPQLLDRVGSDDESESACALLEEYRARRGGGACGGGAAPGGGVVLTPCRRTCLVSLAAP